MREGKSREEIISKAINHYSKQKHLYDKLADKLKTIISDILRDKNISVHDVCSRAKEVDSFSEKIKNEKYDDPVNQITDLAGVRIIVYVESDLLKVCNVITDCFDIDEANSSDKSELLGIDKVGYKSIHYVCSLPPERLGLPEYKKFEGLKFEVQVRTILQHTWAEVEHDRNYKFSGVLPKHLQRRFKLLAGMLEFADIELDNIAKEIDSYGSDVDTKTKKGDLDIPIDSTSIKRYLDTKFKGIDAPYKSTFVNNILEKEILEDLKGFGIDTLADLDAIIPEDFIKKNSLNIHECVDYTYLLRLIMITNNSDAYFQKAWKRNH